MKQHIELHPKIKSVYLQYRKSSVIQARRMLQRRVESSWISITCSSLLRTIRGNGKMDCLMGSEGSSMMMDPFMRDASIKASRNAIMRCSSNTMAASIAAASRTTKPSGMVSSQLIRSSTKEDGRTTCQTARQERCTATIPSSRALLSMG